MQRIMVFGARGAGKSTFSVALGHIMGIEVVHLDLIFLSDGRTEGAREAHEMGLAAALQRPAFVLEGGYRWTLTRRLENCDTVIWLDMPPLRRLVNLLRRKWSRKAPIGQHDDAEEARKRARRIPTLVRIYLDQLRYRMLLEPVLARPPEGLRVIRLRGLAEAESFLAELRK